MERMSDDVSRQRQGTDSDPTGDDPRIVVLTPNGMGVANAPAGDQRVDGEGDHADRSERDEPRERTNPADLVEEPAKVMRIGSMIKQLLEEVRNAPLDEAGRRRLAAIHERSLKELESGLAPELVEELR